MKVDIYDTEERYNLVVSDPPWRQQRGQGKKIKTGKAGKPLDYPTMSLEDIQEHMRQVTEITTDDSILFLWTIEKYLHQAERMAKDLGYRLHARMIWDKENGVPAAYTVRYSHEYLLYMYRGKMIPVADNARGKIPTVFRERAKKHSQKPEKAFEIIDTLYPNLKKLEMYARQERDGYDCFGNEVQK